MLNLPDAIMAYLLPFAPLFTRRTWRHIPLLVAGAILAPGRRMVSSILRVTGHSDDAAFSTYHRVLNRAVWPRLGASHILLGLLIVAFAPGGPLVLGIDETLERRRGKTITATGIYRDPVRSSHGHFVKARALRWVSLMLLVPVPWAGRTWALPFLSVLAPSERYDHEHNRRHKAITDWARQMARVVHRWLPAPPGARRGYRLRRDRLPRCDQDDRHYGHAPAPRRALVCAGTAACSRARGPPLTDPATPWSPLTVPFWYGEKERTIEVVSETAM